MQVPVELKLRYLKRRIEDFEKVRLGLENDDYALALKVGHQVKGNAVTFNIPQMAHFAHEMEQAAEIRDKEKVFLLIQKMESVVQHAQSETI